MPIPRPLDPKPPQPRERRRPLAAAPPVVTRAPVPRDGRVVPLATGRREVAARIVEGESVLLVYRGRALEQALRDSEVPMRSLEEAVREAKLESLADVELAALEASGKIAIVPRWTSPAGRR